MERETLRNIHKTHWENAVKFVEDCVWVARRLKLDGESLLVNFGISSYARFRREDGEVFEKTCHGDDIKN